MNKLLFLIPLLFFPLHASAVVYYIDFTNGSDNNNGLSTTSPFQSLNQFANNARSAGDTAHVRRGQASTTNVTAVTFTSDGTLNNPISITADYDNLWSDFTTSAETYTLAFGSTTLVASGPVTGISANQWIYATGDCTENATTSAAFKDGVNDCEFAYEVESVQAQSIVLYLPYKGNQTSATLRIMPTAPQIGTVTEANQIFTTSSDDYWYFKGLDLRSTNASAIVDGAATSISVTFYDSIFQGDGVSVSAIVNTVPSWVVKKFRLANVNTAITSRGGVFLDGLINCAASGTAFSQAAANISRVVIKNVKVTTCVTFINQSANDISASITNNTFVASITGIKLASFEDSSGIVGGNSLILLNSNSATTTQSSTSNLRTGGGSKNLLVYPPSGTGNTGVSTNNFPNSAIKLFEYPIYADTTSKTYTMYFNSTSTAQWTTDPLTQAPTGSSTPELFIECEYYGNTFNADRKITRSNTANDVDFNGSTAWQDISVTCQPFQAGVLYLRGYYAKPKEGGANWFYMDTTPVIQ
jgi:uncharacterized protein YneR